MNNKPKEDGGRCIAAGEGTEANTYGVVEGNILGTSSSASLGQDNDMESVGLPKNNLRQKLRRSSEISQMCFCR